jgi:penicillin-binding protein 1C|tara:strand:+ start:2083 stop:2346 length:264 start_codon:yes stop_codon:yes gene_type:complete
MGRGNPFASVVVSTGVGGDVGAVLINGALVVGIEVPTDARSVGAVVGEVLGAVVGAVVGTVVGTIVGTAVGTVVGTVVGAVVGTVVA